MSVTVYLWNENGRLIGTTTTTGTAAGGYNYIFPGLPPATYTVSFDTGDPQLAGMALTASPNPGYPYTTTVIVDQDITRLDFGVYAGIDYGDLPASYGTLVVDSGAELFHDDPGGKCSLTCP